MGSDEETSNSSNFYDPSSSPTQPLLSKHHPSPSTTIEPAVGEPDQSHYLHISYKHGHRPIRDLPFLLLFFLLVLCTFAFGLFAFFNRNPNSSSVSSFVYDSNSTSCIKVSSSNAPSLYSSSSNSDFLTILIWTLVVTLILSLPFVLCVLFLLKHFTKQIVYTSIPFFVVLLFFVDVYWFVACTVNSSCSDAFPVVYRVLLLVFVFLVIALVVWIIVLNWHRIELTVKIIGIASHALSQNLGLFGVLPALTLGLVVYYVPIVVFLVFANQNGKIVSKEKSGEYSCAWKQQSWVPAYYALAILTMVWSATAMLEAKAFVISGTIAQWYFSKDHSTPRRSIRNSLRNAFGPSLGTVCFSGLLVCVVRIVRALVDSARQEEAQGMVYLVLQCCVNTLLTAVDFLNKFTINFVAITGEAYCTSARMTCELLERNLLSVIVVETISTRLLAGVVLVLSAIYAILVFAILNAISNLGVESYFVAVLAWVLVIVVLGFFVHVLDNVIDTVYVCYAVDRDRGEVSKQEVHEVYIHLPINRNRKSSPVPKTMLSV